MAQQLLVEYEDDFVDTALLSKDPENTLKKIIAQQSKGNFSPDLFHLVVRTIMGMENNNLKRLLYYFFECLDKDDKSFTLCVSQVNKDLVSPNEFVRGFVLRFVSKLQSWDYANLFLKSVKENLSHSNSYVRTNALFCLGELGIRFDLDVEGDIMDIMRRESSPEVLTVGFNTMHKLGMNFDDFLSINYPKEVLEVLSHKVDDPAYLRKLSNSKFNSVAFNACCKLLVKLGCSSLPSAGSSVSENDKNACLESIINILEDSPDLKHDFIPYLKFVDSHALEFLNLINPYEVDFSSKVIDVCFKNADTQNFRKIADFLYQKYLEHNQGSEKKKTFKILLLDKMTHFSLSHCIYIEDLIPLSLQNILVPEPELQFSSLNFLKTCLSRDYDREIIHSFLVENFTNLRFGKILRRAFDILSESIDKSSFDKLLDVLMNNFSLQPEPFYLSNAPDVYIGAYICISLTQMYKKDWDLKNKTLGVLLKFIEHGKLNNIIDMSSESTIATCVRSILSDGSKNTDISFDTIDYSHQHVISPAEFSLIKTKTVFKKFHPVDALISKQKTVQLSGLGDPLYVETNVLYSKCELFLDLLIINQTSSYLQAVVLDFSYSKNLQLVSSLESFALQPNCATTLKVKFAITESLTGFVSATISFKYPKKEDYSARPFVQYLDEIKLNINEFLEAADVDFQAQWQNLEWENIYSISMKKDVKDILEQLVRKVNGKLCNRLTNFGFIVANIACYTIQKTLVLINVSINSSEHSLIEIRVRSRDEEIVKNVSSLLSHYLKTI